MKRVLIGVVAIALSGLALASASASELWQGSSYGDSLAKTQEIHPNGAIEIDEKSKLKSGAIKKFAIDDLDVAEKKFKASFHFLGDGLDRVVLTHRGPGELSQCNSLFRRVYEGLKVKYGEPLSPISGPSEHILAAKFVSNKTEITLNMMTMPAPNACYVSVGYGTNLSRESKNL